MNIERFLNNINAPFKLVNDNGLVIYLIADLFIYLFFLVVVRSAQFDLHEIVFFFSVRSFKLKRPMRVNSAELR